MIKQLILKAEKKAGGQEKAGEILQINRTRLADFKNGKRKPSEDFILRLAEYLNMDKGETLYQAKLELDPENAGLWKFLVRSAGLEPTPQASELKTIHRALKLPYFIQCLQIAIIVKVCVAFGRRNIPMTKQVFNRINAHT